MEAFDYVGALDDLVGPNLTNFFVVVICASFVISMNTATADGSRALYGISKDGLTVKQLGRLNRWNVPGQRDVARHGHQHPLRPLRRQPLRHPRREQHRLRLRKPLRDLGIHPARGTGRTGRGRSSCPSYWVAIAAVLCGGVRRLRDRGRRLVPDRRRRRRVRRTKEKIIGFGVLVISLLLFLFRRIVQDKETPHWREETPTMPDEHVAEASRGRDGPGVGTGMASVREAATAASLVSGSEFAHGSIQSRPSSRSRWRARSPLRRRSAPRTMSRRSGRRSSSARASRAIRPLRSGGRSGCSRPASRCSRRGSASRCTA